MLSPSILSANFANLEQDFEWLNRSEADFVHLDVMDGVFVPNISFGFPVAEAMSRLSTKPLDIHLMITHPERYVQRFCALKGAEYVGFHLEATDDPMPAIRLIHEAGCKACLTINPDIEVERLFPYLREVEMVLVMSVFAGFGGQKFIPETMDKVRVLRAKISRQGLATLIEVDGGVNPDNAPDLYRAGADVLVAGTSVFRAPDPLQAIRTMRS